MNCVVITTDFVLPVLLQAEMAEEKAIVRSFEAWRNAETEFLLGNIHPDVLVFDLEHQPTPESALEALARCVSSHRILVLTGAASLITAEDLNALGFPHALSRPCTIEELMNGIHKISNAQPKETA